MEKREVERLVKQLVSLSHKVAKRVKRSHDGWWRSYASREELELVKISDRLERLGIR